MGRGQANHHAEPEESRHLRHGNGVHQGKTLLKKVRVVLRQIGEFRHLCTGLRKNDLRRLRPLLEFVEPMVMRRVVWPWCIYATPHQQV